MANREATRDHYRDVVVPFRERQPGYQRRWRLGQRLREIREKIAPFASAMLATLRSLWGGADALWQRPATEAQTGVLAANLLGQAKVALGGGITALEQLAELASALATLGV